jgi:cysteine desulfurase
VAEAARLVHAAGGLLLVDAVQVAGKIPFSIKELGADFLILSAHKIGGPKGVGALIKARETLHFPEPLLRGGGQERGARGGTENIIGISGFGAAAAAARAALAGPATAARPGPTAPRPPATAARPLRDRLETGLLAIAPATVIFGAAAERLPNTTLFAVPGMRAETALIALDLAGVAVSSGSACSSGKVGPSHVLAAMGADPALAAGAIRVSTGAATTDAEIDLFLEAWRKHVAALSKGRRGLAA